MKKVLSVIVIISVAFSIYLFGYFYQRTDNLSLRYNLWKMGLYSYPSDHISHAVISDQNRNLLILGKTKAEIKNIFLNANEESITEHQTYYAKELEDKEYLWLGQSGVIIILKNGLGYEITIMKG